MLGTSLTVCISLSVSDAAWCSSVECPCVVLQGSPTKINRGAPSAAASGTERMPPPPAGVTRPDLCVRACLPAPARMDFARAIPYRVPSLRACSKCTGKQMTRTKKAPSNERAHTPLPWPWPCLSSRRGSGSGESGRHARQERGAEWEIRTEPGRGSAGRQVCSGSSPACCSFCLFLASGSNPCFYYCSRYFLNPLPVRSDKSREHTACRPAPAARAASLFESNGVRASCRLAPFSDRRHDGGAR